MFMMLFFQCVEATSPSPTQQSEGRRGQSPPAHPSLPALLSKYTHFIITLQNLKAKNCKNSYCYMTIMR